MERDWYADISNIASTQECTGLMSRPPQTEEEYEAFQEIYGMETPKV